MENNNIQQETETTIQIQIQNTNNNKNSSNNQNSQNNQHPQNNQNNQNPQNNQSFTLWNIELCFGIRNRSNLPKTQPQSLFAFHRWQTNDEISLQQLSCKDPKRFHLTYNIHFWNHLDAHFWWIPKLGGKAFWKKLELVDPWQLTVVTDFFIFFFLQWFVKTDFFFKWMMLLSKTWQQWFDFWFKTVFFFLNLPKFWCLLKKLRWRNDLHHLQLQLRSLFPTRFFWMRQSLDLSVWQLWQVSEPLCPWVGHPSNCQVCRHGSKWTQSKWIVTRYFPS